MSLKQIRVFVDGEVIATPHFSGIGRYTLETLRAIDRQLDNNSSLKVVLLVYYKYAKKVSGYGFKNITIRKTIFPLRFANILKTLNIQPPLDIFFGRGTYIFPNFSSWPLLFSKNISFIYDMSFEKYPEFSEPKNRSFLSKQVRKTIRRADVIATISNSSKNDIIQFYSLPIDKKVEVLYPAVDRDLFYKRNPTEISAVKKKYGLKDNYILFVGNIEPRKNLKKLLLAYEKLPVTIQNEYPLLIVGANGWQNKEINDIFKRIERKNHSVSFPNSRVTDDDLPAIYSGARLFVYPSIYEGFGIPPLEAMACGIPTITSNNSSLPEAVGDAAKLIDADSVEQLTDAIRDLLPNRGTQEQLVTKGFRQVNKYSWDNTSRKLLKIIENFDK